MKSRNLPGPLPLGELLELNAKKSPDQIALIKKGEYTYGQMEKMVRRIAYHLKKKGVKKGDKIGILAQNGPEWIICFFAIQYVGGICVPLDVRSGYIELKGIMEHSETSLLFVQKKLLKIIEEIVREKKINVITINGEEGSESILHIISRDTLEAERERTVIDDPCVLFYTSGTTGAQKGVLLTHRNVVSNIYSLLQSVRVDQKDRFFSVLPMSHAYELVAGNLVPIAACAQVAYASSLKPREMIEDMIASKPTIILTVPLILEKLLVGIEKRIRESSPFKRFIFQSFLCIPGLKEIVKRSVRKSMGLERMRFFVSGGAHLPETVELGLRKLGLEVIQGYGLTEASPVVSLNPPERPKPGSCGLPLPGIEIIIVNKGEDGVGEIAVRGENVMRGYYRNEEATKEVLLPDGLLLTGDMGYLDNDGYLYLTGRKKSVIVTKGGLTIYPEEIENALSQSPYIKEALVLKRKKEHGEELHALVVPDEDALRKRIGMLSSPDEEARLINEILKSEIDSISRSLAGYKRVRSFSIRKEEFPKTSTNKIKRYLFQES